MTTSAVKQVRAVLADDHDLVREGIASLLESIGVQVVGQAADGEALLDLVAGTHPDIIFLDIVMPRAGGLFALARLQQRHPEIPAVVLSLSTSGDTIRDAATLGARGYLLKNAPRAQLQEALDCVLGGGSYFNGQIAAALLASSEGPRTDRQEEIIKLIALGKSTKEIARELDLSPRTVEVHRSRIMERLGIHDVAGLTRYAVRQGLIDA